MHWVYLLSKAGMLRKCHFNEQEVAEESALMPTFAIPFFFLLKKKKGPGFSWD